MWLEMKWPMRGDDKHAELRSWEGLNVGWEMRCKGYARRCEVGCRNNELADVEGMGVLQLERMTGGIFCGEIEYRIRAVS